MNEIMVDGFFLMIYGMGFVFIFLSALVISTKAMSRFVQAFFASPHQADKKSHIASPSKNLIQTADPNLRLAIKEAIHRYRKDHY